MSTKKVLLPRVQAQLIMVFQISIKSTMLKNKDFSRFHMLRCCIYHTQKF